MRSPQRRVQLLLIDLIFLTGLTFVVGLVGKPHAVYQWMVIVVVFIAVVFHELIVDVFRWLDKRLPKK